MLTNEDLVFAFLSASSVVSLRRKQQQPVQQQHTWVILVKGCICTFFCDTFPVEGSEQVQILRVFNNMKHTEG